MQTFRASTCVLSLFNCARAKVLFLLFLFPVSFRDCLQVHPRKRPAPPLSTAPLYPSVVLQHAHSVLVQISHVSLSIARSPLPSFPAARSLSLSLSLIIALRSPCTRSHRRNSRARTLNLLRILTRSTAIHRPILALLFIARFASPCAFPPAPAFPCPTLSLSPRASSRSLAPSSLSASPIVAHTPLRIPSLNRPLSLIARSRARANAIACAGSNARIAGLRRAAPFELNERGAIYRESAREREEARLRERGGGRTKKKKLRGRHGLWGSPLASYRASAVDRPRKRASSLQGSIREE